MRQLLTITCLVLMFIPPAVSADWPMYAHDRERSNITDEELKLPLRKVWTYICTQPPSPAWEDPVKNLNRLDFDYAAVPVVAEGIVCFGSSADDTVRALDLKTGKEKWHYITGGPIRFAPQIWGGNVYACSDDGQVYCLSAMTGKLIWTFNPVRQDERMIGNGRMISRWPIRSGLLIDKGILYFIAGMWPSEGIYAYALSARTGKVIWLNDTSGATKVIVGHVITTVSGVNPQGAVAATDDTLVYPMGRSSPATYDRKTGKLLKYAPGLANGSGGSWITLSGTNCYLYAKSFYSPLSVGALTIDTMLRNIKAGSPVAPNSAFMGAWQFSVYEGKTSAIVQKGKITGRYAYCLIKAGKTLFVGKEGSVNSEGPEPAWRGMIDGKAYAMAVADGRLIVSTDKGEISCFAASTTTGKLISHISKRTLSTAKTVSALVRRIKNAGMDRGYALVLGDTTGATSIRLATETQLHVITALTQSGDVSALREKLLATTPLYGSRIHVQHIPRLGSLPFARYFANVVIVGSKATGVSGPELYRVLRPHGGLLQFTGKQGERAARLIEDAGIPDTEIRSRTQVIRAGLDGELNWDSKTRADRLVKWPLRPIWFGEPGASRNFNRKVRGQPIVAVANGRFAVSGDTSLTVVDAYNGTILWEKQLAFSPRGNGALINADDKYVYYTIGKTSLLLDAGSGRQIEAYATGVRTNRVSIAKETHTWPISAEAKKQTPQKGTVALGMDNTSLIVTLKTPLPDKTTERIDWSVFLDFRPHDRRYGFYEDGTYEYRVFPSRGEKSAHWRAGAGSRHPPVTVSGTETETTFKLAWKDITPLNNRMPESFGFGAVLTRRKALASHMSILSSSLVKGYLFCNNKAAGINLGWLTVYTGTIRTEGSPAIIKGILEDKRSKTEPPPYTTLLPDAKWRPRNIRIDQTLVGTSRIHPLTGQRTKKFWARPFGCGGVTASASCALTRGGTLSIYDFDDDSGLRNFGGVRHSCGVSSIAANGVWLSTDGGAGCECTYNFLTSVAFAGADRRLDEDWAMFAEWRSDSIIRHAYLNMGAPGDRRESPQILWLGIPRLQTEKAQTAVMGTHTYTGMDGVWQQPISMSMPVPLDVEFMEGFGPYRVNADRVPIAGTDKPWLYTSCYRGIRKATLKLEFASEAAARRITGAPLILDGKLDEECWKGDPAATLEFTKSTVAFAYDDENLYIGVRRPPVIDRKGKARNWSSRKGARDAQGFHMADVWECFISDTKNEKVVHIATSATGSLFDGLAEGMNGESKRWNGSWKSAVVADTEAGFCVEFQIPWSMLARLDIDREDLAVNVMVGRHPKVSESIVRVGSWGTKRCNGFVRLGLGKRPERKMRLYTVRLHFAELNESARPGMRVFDVKLQGRTVLKNFDISREAGGPFKALVKEFTGVEADEMLITEFISAGTSEDATKVPVINAIEIVMH